MFRRINAIIPLMEAWIVVMVLGLLTLVSAIVINQQAKQEPTNTTQPICEHEVQDGWWLCEWDGG